MLLARECHVTLLQKEQSESSSSSPLKIHHYRVNTKKTRTKVVSAPSKKATTQAYLEPGAIVEVYGNRTVGGYLHIIRPLNGFVSFYSSTTGKKLVAMVDDDDELDPPATSGICPIVYSGSYRSNRSYLNQRYSFAPTHLVVAQQFWNALTVCFLVLLLVVCCHDGDDTSFSMRPGIRVVAVCSVFLLPFSVYHVSPGGNLSAILYAILGVIGIVRPTVLNITMRPVPSVVVDILRGCRHRARRRDGFLLREELVGFLVSCFAACTIIHRVTVYGPTGTPNSMP
jgi:hypothetical protein